MAAVIAYLCNQFPSPVEHYVGDEIRELRQGGITVIPCSARRAECDTLNEELQQLVAETLYIRPLSFRLLRRSLRLILDNLPLILSFLRSALFSRREPRLRRIAAVAH